MFLQQVRRAARHWQRFQHMKVALEDRKKPFKDQCQACEEIYVMHYIRVHLGKTTLWHPHLT
jgi:hypothetical protein